MEKQIVEYSITDGQIAEWKQMYSGMKIEGEGKERKESYNAIKSALTTIKDQRILVEKTRKELKSDALAWGKKVDAEAKRIKLLLTPIEDELKATKQAEDNIEIERKKKEERIEQERIDKIKQKIVYFDSESNKMLSDYSATSGTLKSHILFMDAFKTAEEFFQEFLPEIEMKKTEALEKLNEAYEKKLDQEKEAAELKKQKEEQERIAKEQAEAQKKIDADNKIKEEKQLAEQKKFEAEKAEFEAEKKLVEAEKIRKEKEAQAKIDEANRKTKEAEEAKKKAEQKAKADKLKAEQDKIQAKKEAREKIEREKLKAEEKKKAEELEKERKELLRPDKERLINFFNSFKSQPLNLNNEVSKTILSNFENEFEILLQNYSDKVMKEL